jgi:hypothetical protein
MEVALEIIRAGLEAAERPLVSPRRLAQAN